MAKPNYRQQKRQKEIARKSRQSERLARRTTKSDSEDGTLATHEDAAAPGAVTPGAVAPGLSDV